MPTSTRITDTAPMEAKLPKAGRRDGFQNGLRVTPVRHRLDHRAIDRLRQAGLGGRFEGRSSEDRKTLTGVLQRGPMSMPWF